MQERQAQSVRSRLSHSPTCQHNTEGDTEVVVSPPFYLAPFAIPKGLQTAGPGSALSDGHLHWHPERDAALLHRGGLTAWEKERSRPQSQSIRHPCFLPWPLPPPSPLGLSFGTHPPSISIKPSHPHNPSQARVTRFSRFLISSIVQQYIHHSLSIQTIISRLYIAASYASTLRLRLRYQHRHCRRQSLTHSGLPLQETPFN